jgi:heme-degrading monooxygenase HmoA
VIARLWRGWTAPADADRYDEHYRDEVLSSLRGVPGFRGARLLREDGATETEFVSITFFEDLDAVRAFAGEDYLTAVVADEARRVLSRFDPHVRVYEVAFEV